jgi:hypothetical protein
MTAQNQDQNQKQKQAQGPSSASAGLRRGYGRAEAVPLQRKPVFG